MGGGGRVRARRWGLETRAAATTSVPPAMVAEATVRAVRAAALAAVSSGWQRSAAAATKREGNCAPVRAARDTLRGSLSRGQQHGLSIENGRDQCCVWCFSKKPPTPSPGPGIRVAAGARRRRRPSSSRGLFFSRASPRFPTRRFIALPATGTPPAASHSPLPLPSCSRRIQQPPRPPSPSFPPSPRAREGAPHGPHRPHRRRRGAPSPVAGGAPSRDFAPPPQPGVRCPLLPSPPRLGPSRVVVAGRWRGTGDVIRPLPPRPPVRGGRRRCRRRRPVCGREGLAVWGRDGAAR